MRDINNKTFYTALAFCAVGLNKQERDAAENVDDIVRLAELAEAFCHEHTGTSGSTGLSWVGDRESEKVDGLIEKHLRELRDKEMTRLPENRETLMCLYDRLQVRKARRVQREFYVTASEAKVSDLVLRLLDEELAARGGLT